MNRFTKRHEESIAELEELAKNNSPPTTSSMATVSSFVSSAATHTFRFAIAVIAAVGAALSWLGAKFTASCLFQALWRAFSVSSRGYSLLHGLGLVFTLCVGAFISLFGGYFITSLAAFEAVKLCGWQTIKQGVSRCLADIRGPERGGGTGTEGAASQPTANLVSIAVKDDVEPASAGQPPVTSAPSEPGQDRLALLMATPDEPEEEKGKRLLELVDPNNVASVFAGGYAAVVSVAATLHVMRPITLGCAVGDQFHSSLGTLSGSSSMGKWGNLTAKGVARSVGVATAYVVMHVGGNTLFPVFYAAVRGSFIVTSATLRYTSSRKLTIPYDEASPLFLVLMLLLCVISIALHFKLGAPDTAVWPLNLLIAPFSLCDFMLASLFRLPHPGALLPDV